MGNPNPALDLITTWVTDTCCALAPIPHAVRVHEVVNNEEILVIEIRPDPRNAGQILGKDGATIGAMRLIAIGMLRMRAGHRSLLMHVVTEAKEEGAAAGLPARVSGGTPGGSQS